jgi:hypothetical protein
MRLPLRARTSEGGGRNVLSTVHQSSAHLIEPTHNARFVALMDGAMPQWRIVREQLNRLPVRHDEWAY